MGIFKSIFGNRQIAPNTPQPSPIEQDLAKRSQPMFTAGTPRGLSQPGNIDLATRPQVKNPDGSISTVRTVGFTMDDGKVILVPSVHPDGRVMSAQEANEYSKQTGQHLGIFNSQAEADEYAEALHRQQEQMYLSGR